MHYLLDKNVVRHAITAFRDGFKRPLLPLELGALTFWRVAEMRAARVFISEASFNVLQTRLHYDEAIVFLDFVEVLSPTRYHTRWARRIRETTKLSREDAAMIALATLFELKEQELNHITFPARGPLPWAKQTKFAFAPTG